MTSIRFDSGITVTIRVANRNPREANADIARGIVEKIGLGEIVAPIYSQTP